MTITNRATSYTSLISNILSV